MVFSDFKSDVFDPYKLRRMFPQKLSGLLLVTAWDDRTQQFWYAASSQNADMIVAMTDGKMPSEFVEVLKQYEMHARWQKQITGVEPYFVIAPGHVEDLLDDFPLLLQTNVDYYGTDLERSPQEFREKYTNITAHYFFLYNLQQKFTEDRREAHTILDLDSESAKSKLTRLCKDAFGNHPAAKRSAETYINAFLPEPQFTKNRDALPTIDPHSKYFEKAVSLQIRIIIAVADQEYEKAGLAHDNFLDLDKL